MEIKKEHPVIINASTVISEAQRIPRKFINAHPHPNVALHSYQDKIYSDDQQHYNSWTVYKETLERRIRKIPLEDRKYVLLQIVHGLKHLHDSGIIVGSLTLKSIWISEDGRRVIITDVDSKPKSKEADIKSLGLNVFKKLKLMGEQQEENQKSIDYKLAEDLFGKMTRKEQPLDATKILQHPFFWSAEKKINFFVKIQTLLTSDDDKIFDKINEGSAEVISNGPYYESSKWNEHLELLDHEMSEVEKVAKVEGFHAQKLVWRNLAEETQPRSYDHTKVYPLIAFIRNSYIHPSNNETLNFYVSNTSKYWEFFSRRFPMLFSHFYNIMLKDGSYKLTGEGVRQAFLEEVAENKLLPLQNK